MNISFDDFTFLVTNISVFHMYLSLHTCTQFLEIVELMISILLSLIDVTFIIVHILFLPYTQCKKGYFTWFDSAWDQAHHEKYMHSVLSAVHFISKYKQEWFHWLLEFCLRTTFFWQSLDFLEILPILLSNTFENQIL